MPEAVTVEVKQGKRGNWRSEVFDLEGNLVFVSPVKGYGTDEERARVARRILLVGERVQE